MTIKMDRSKVLRLSSACLQVALMLENEAADPETPASRREIAKSNAQYWYDLRDEVRAQVDAWDLKHQLKL